MISVIMPVYNAEKYICQSVESILKQTYTDFELILIDDCGTDKSIDLVKKTFSDTRIKYYRNDKNMGIAYSRNRGLEVATGEFVAFMDDDDIAPLNRLELEMKFLEENPDIDAVGGRYSVIDEKGRVTGYSDDTLQNPKFIKACLMFFDPLGNGSMLFRRSTVIDNRIRFREDCYGMEDYLFWIDFSLVGKISNLKDIMLCWRNIEGNETRRCTGEMKSKRAAKFAEIQRYAIEKNGFELSKEDLNILTGMLSEGRFEKIVSKEDVEKLYRVLKDIIGQAKEKDMDNQNEIAVACRKQFSRRLEYSEVWNL